MAYWLMPDFHPGAFKCRESTCAAGNRKDEDIFGRARRDQPHNYSRRSLRHCPYCKPVKAHLESQCPTTGTCSASLSGRHPEFLSLEEPSICASLLLCVPARKATPARGHTSKQASQQHSPLTNKEISSSPVISLG